MSLYGAPDMSGTANNGYMSSSQADALSSYMLMLNRVSEYETMSGVETMSAENLTQEVQGDWQLAQFKAQAASEETQSKLGIMGLQETEQVSSTLASAGARGVGSSPSSLLVMNQQVTLDKMQQNALIQETNLTNQANILAAYIQVTTMSNQATIDQYQAQGDQLRSQDTLLSAQLKLATANQPGGWVQIGS